MESTLLLDAGGRKFYAHRLKNIAGVFRCHVESGKAAQPERAARGNTFNLPYATVTDASLGFGDRKFQPFKVFFPSLPRTAVHLREHSLLGGMVEELDAAALGLGPKSTRFKHLKAWFHQASLEYILEPLRTLSWEGLAASVGTRKLQLYPTPAFSPADIQEYGAMFLVRTSNKSAMPDPASLASKQSLDDPDAAFGPRTEEAMRKASLHVIERAQKLQKDKKAREAKELLKKWSLSTLFLKRPEDLFDDGIQPGMAVQLGEPLFKHCAFAGFCGVDCYQLMAPDRLHSSKGLLEPLVLYPTEPKKHPGHAMHELLAGSQGVQHQLDAIEALIRQALPFPGLRLHSELLRATQTSITEVAALAHVLPPALAGCAELRPLLLALIGGLAAPLLCFQRSVLEHVDSVRNWCTLKFYLTSSFERAILRVGAAYLTDTSPQENQHKYISAHASDAAAANELCLPTRKRRRRRSMQSRALEDRWGYALPSLKSMKPVCVAELSAGRGAAEAAGASSAAAKLLCGRPELEHLEFSMRANDLIKEEDENASESSLAPPALRPALYIMDSCVRAYRKHVGGPLSAVTLLASPKWGETKKPTFHCVSVSSKDGEAIWFGQLVAFVVVRGAPAHQQDWAFVRWFEGAAVTPASRSLRMTRLRWCNHDHGSRLMPFYDLVPLADVREPVFIQPDPVHAGYFHYNHFVRGM
eukprot:scaffold27.g6002.t1